ncbi:MAG TPA: hypothetical protein VNK82_12255 [Terriglobales bacterium]|nr:hypothetical protein [Terriglobales bacterium]
MDDETVFDAVAKLSHAYRFAVSIEYPLTSTTTRTLPPSPRFTARVEDKTLREVLDWLFTLDSRYTWSRDLVMVNVLPRSKTGDQLYLLNRRLALVSFQDVPDAEKAVFAVLRLVPDKKENPAVLQLGHKPTFGAPWTATFEEMTVREAFNRIAQQLGPSYGWQYTGTEEFQLITFHEKVQPLRKPDR